MGGCPDYGGYRAEGDSRRITVGGYDEAGSSGFNQIQNKNAYGGLSDDGTDRSARTCTPVSAYSQDGESRVNHYDPGQNILAKAVWLAGEQGNCGRSFRRAFTGTDYQGTYESALGMTLLRIDTGDIDEAATAGTHVDDNYEKLAKGLGGYNQGAGIFGNAHAWLDLLTRPKAENSDAETTAIRYAIHIMHDNDKLNLPYRTYVWQGGITPDGIAWCFEYGESEWMNPGFQVRAAEGGTRGAEFRDYYRRARRNPQPCS